MIALETVAALINQAVSALFPMGLSLPSGVLIVCVFASYAVVASFNERC